MTYTSFGLRSVFALLVSLGAIFISPLHSFAGPGDLLVSPVRVVFEGRERSAELTLINRGAETSIFRINFEQKRMRQDGSFETISEAADGEKFSDQFVRYAPRSIELEPNKPQTIRLLLRKPGDLEDGEYRSHLLFRAVPEETTDNLGDDDATELSIKLTPVYGITIPVIVRQGDLSADVAIESADLVTKKDGSPALKVSLTRSGSRSVYGALEVYDSNRPDDDPLGFVSGVSIYTPNKGRDVYVPITSSIQPGAQVQVRFRETKGSQNRVEASRVIATR